MLAHETSRHLNLAKQKKNAMIIMVTILGSLRNRTAGRLRAAEWRKNVARGCAFPISYATSFRHSAVLSVPIVSSLLLERDEGKQLHRPTKLMTKRFRALWYFFNEYGKTFNWVNNKLLEYDWLLTVLIYGLIGRVRSKLSGLPNRAVKQQIKIKHFMQNTQSTELP